MRILLGYMYNVRCHLGAKVYMLLKNYMLLRVGPPRGIYSLQQPQKRCALYSRRLLEDGADDLLGQRVLHGVRLGHVLGLAVLQAVHADVASTGNPLL